MFKPATNRVNFPTIDTDVLEFWEQNKIFERPGFIDSLTTIEKDLRAD